MSNSRIREVIVAAFATLIFQRTRGQQVASQSVVGGVGRCSALARVSALSIHWGIANVPDFLST
jgi:hypothetical protein